MTELSGWGRYPRHETELVSAGTPAAVPSLLAERRGLIARGRGRAYGDAAIGDQTTVGSCQLNRMRSFDPVSGRLTVEAGVQLADILAVFMPRGFFPPVVPGTKFVTVGGMIAADVHGKNHHRVGGFGDHVEEMTLALPSGETVVCSRSRNTELFDATVGGMGLTGVIVEATFCLRPIETGWMRQHTVVAGNLDEAITALSASAIASYSVAWIDCLARGRSLGRSLIYAAEHASVRHVEGLRPGAELFPSSRLGRVAVPIDLPPFVLGRVSVSAFNELYFRAGAITSGYPFLVPWDPYFFPLDGIGDWNRIYGRRGFVQYQCVVPTSAARSTLGEILERTTRAGKGSFLAVLKQLGPSSGLLSFPSEGYTLALDLPVSREVLQLLNELDEIVVAAGGRLYLAKDARQSPNTFMAGYPHLARFRDLRRALGADGHLVSKLSARLNI